MFLSNNVKALFSIFILWGCALGYLNKENIVDEIKSRCDIVEVIGRVVSLKKTGSNIKGLCPFHNEKTPSFVVSDTRQRYFCFGCNATGDVLEFVQKYYNLDFKGAMEKLASDYNIDISSADFSASNKEELYEINKIAAKFFFNSFWEAENPANTYMQKRGITPDILRKFGIGYADGEWKSLLEHFNGLGIDTKLLISLGLVTESSKGHFDRFRDRVMFPIINATGKVIGFGGRELTGGEPKYLNSAESSIFLKKNNLFGLNLTRQDINKENRAILVEGYMDVISLYQHGVRNVSASLGTALTGNQAKLLKRYAESVTIAYDADQAGQAAALRGGEILYEEGLKVKILKMPEGKDPDDFIKEHKKTQFLEILDAALPYVEYKLDIIKGKYNIEDTEAKLDFIKEAVAFLKTLSPATAEMYIKTIAKNTKISESAIMLEYRGNVAFQTQQRDTTGNFQSGEGFEKTPDDLEKNLLRLCFAQNEYFQKIKVFENVFTSKKGYEIFQALEAQYSQKNELDIKSLTDSLDDNCAKLVQNILESIFLAGKEEQIFLDCINQIKLRELLEQEKEIVLKLSMADETLHKEQVEKLTKELMELQSKIRNIKR